MDAAVWRRIAWIEFWLCLFPPWGMWLLWRDTLLTKPVKQRVIFYTFVIPIVVLIAISARLMIVTEHAIQAAGGGY